MNYGGVCRTAPATPGLLKTCILRDIVRNFVIPRQPYKSPLQKIFTNCLPQMRIYLYFLYSVGSISSVAGSPPGPKYISSQNMIGQSVQPMDITALGIRLAISTHNVITALRILMASQYGQ